MLTPVLFLWVVVAAVGVFSVWMRNPTAVALVIAKCAGAWWVWKTGDKFPVVFYACTDIFCLAVIFAKYEACNTVPYRGIRYHVGCVILEQSVPDRIVMMIFPVMWYFYVADMHFYYVWWALYWLVLAQFFAVGWESLCPFFRRALKALSNKPGNTGSMLVAYEGGGGGG